MSKNDSSLVLQALREDIGIQDVTTNILVPTGRISKAYIVVKEPTVLCGLAISKKVFQTLDKGIKFNSKFKDGDWVPKNTKVIYLKGRTRAILTAERTALNFLSHLSGIATKTRSFVRKTRPYKTIILDTRKTIPGLRSLQKNAVRGGGGTNHRKNLGEMILIKDNHRVLLGGKCDWPQVIAMIKKKTAGKKIEVEVNNLRQFKAVLKARPDIILLDNMKITEVKKAVCLCKEIKGSKRPKLEASGGISFKNVGSYARTGVNMISLGELTHTSRAIDMSLEIEK